MYSEKEIWYRADFDYVPENYGGGTQEYLCLTLDSTTTMEELDQEAIDWAKNLAEQGANFSDVGHVDMELVQLCEVDGTKECFPEIRTVWY